MPSKMVTDRQKSAAVVEQAAATHAELVGGRLTEFFSPFAKPGAPAIDFGSLFELLAATLAAHRQRMEAADDAHTTELGDDAPARDERDAAAAALHGSLVDLRATVEGLFGPGSAGAVLALDGQTASDPVVLERQAALAVERLRTDGLTLPAMRLPGLTFDPAAAAGALDPALERLRAALRAVSREAKEAEDTLIRKNRALDAFNTTFRGVAGTLESLFRLAGEPDLADRVRPSSRRPGTTIDETNLEGADGATTPSQKPAEEEVSTTA